MKKILLTSLFLFTVFSVFSARAESIVPDGVEHIDSYSVTINIKADSTVSVAETIEYNFGDETKPGIVRYIPLDYQDLSGSDIAIDVRDVLIEDREGNSYIFNQEQFRSDDNKKNYLKLNIGDQSQLVSGSKTYVIRYTASGAIKFLNDHDELFWDITGNKWPIYVKYPEIKINLPQRVARENVTKQCLIGLPAATIGCIDRINNRKDPDAYYSYKGVVSGERMSTVMGFPKGVVRKNSLEQQDLWGGLKANLYKQGLIFLLLLIIVLTLTLILVHVRKIAAFFSWKKLSKTLLYVRKKMKSIQSAYAKKNKNKSSRWWVLIVVISLVILASGVVAFWRLKATMNKISVKGTSLSNLVQAGLDSQGPLKGENDDQINILLLGVLGANHPGGGLNTDTIMVASIKPKANKISLVSIPRDLWVTDPGRENKSKINAVYIYGEEKGPGQGIADMESLISDITGLPIHYAAVVSTAGFVQLVDTLGGVEVDLTKPFNESAQFIDIKVCDTETYTIPTGEFQERTKKKKVVSRYPLCKNKNPECGGNFSLPAGKNLLSGEKTLCFIRSRYLTSDFERAKRQQLVLQQLKKKSTQFGFSDFGKINSILNNLGDNIRTDMQLSEIRRLFELYKGMAEPKMHQRVLEDSKEGLLYSPDATPETGFILLPRGDNYDKIKNLFQDIFSSKNQSDIKPQI
jgi:LCP family protein required for cell wall assembly